MVVSRFSPGAGDSPEGWPDRSVPSTIAGTHNHPRVRAAEVSGLIAIPLRLADQAALPFSPVHLEAAPLTPSPIAKCLELTDSGVTPATCTATTRPHALSRLAAEAPDRLDPATVQLYDGPFPSSRPIQRWISLWVATDVVPLLVHSCSDRCIDALPQPPGVNPADSSIRSGTSITRTRVAAIFHSRPTLSGGERRACAPHGPRIRPHRDDDRDGGGRAPIPQSRGALERRWIDAS